MYSLIRGKCINSCELIGKLEMVLKISSLPLWTSVWRPQPSLIVGLSSLLSHRLAHPSSFSPSSQGFPYLLPSPGFSILCCALLFGPWASHILVMLKKPVLNFSPPSSSCLTCGLPMTHQTFKWWPKESTYSFSVYAKEHSFFASSLLLPIKGHLILVKYHGSLLAFPGLPSFWWSASLASERSISLLFFLP